MIIDRRLTLKRLLRAEPGKSYIDQLRSLRRLRFDKASTVPGFIYPVCSSAGRALMGKGARRQNNLSQPPRASHYPHAL